MRFYLSTGSLFTILSTAMILHYSCTQTSAHPVAVVDSIMVKGQPVTTGLRVSDIVEDVRFVPLESKSDIIIGEINKIVQYKDKLFVVDRFSASSVFVFDTSGTFLHKVGSVGKNPGQYTYPHDIFIDSTQQLLLLLDAETRRINYYKISDGQFVRSEGLPVKATRFYKYGDFYAFAGGRDGSLVITDANFKNPMNFFPDEKGAIKTVHQSFHNIGDSLLLFELNYNDTLYKIEKDKLIPYRKIVYDNDGVTYNDKQTLQPTDDITNKFKDKRVTFRYYFETSDHILFTFMQEKRFFIVLKSKRNSRVTIFPTDKVRNDVTFEAMFPEMMSVNSNNEVIAVVPDLITTGERTKNFLAAHTELNDSITNNYISLLKQGVAKGMANRTANPILVFFRLKK
jgi:hypothetical protein